MPAMSGVFQRITTLRSIPFHVSCTSLFSLNPLALYLNLTLDYYLENKSLPWDYTFKFVIDEISNVNDKTQVKAKHLI